MKLGDLPDHGTKLFSNKLQRPTEKNESKPKECGCKQLILDDPETQPEPIPTRDSPVCFDFIVVRFNNKKAYKEAKCARNCVETLTSLPQP